MTYLIAFIVCFIAGIGAGLGTGFAGMSAAAVISPMLITFLGMDPYMAVGIALASDVLASAISAYTYGKNGNLDIKNGAVMMAAVLCFTRVGRRVSGVLGLELNTAGGSRVFFLAFTALSGSVSHFAIGGAPDLFCLVCCVLSTLLWARIAAKFANKSEPATLNRATGVVLVMLGVAILAVNYL